MEKDLEIINYLILKPNLKENTTPPPYLQKDKIQKRNIIEWN